MKNVLPMLFGYTALAIVAVGLIVLSGFFVNAGWDKSMSMLEDSCLRLDEAHVLCVKEDSPP